MLESKRKALIFFLIAILLAAASGFLILQKVKDLNTDLGTVVKIYVAKKDVNSRQVITPNDITTDEIPKKYLRDEHVRNVEDLINKVSTVPLSKGNIITKNMLKDASAVTDVDNRLITLLSSDKVYFDEILTALDRVDILVSHNLGKEPVTEVFLEDVKVARVAAAKKDDTEETDDGFAGVQVEVPYEVVPELIHMQNYADSMRIVKANVGQLTPTKESAGEAEAATEETNDKEAEATPKETTEKKEDSESTKEKQAAETKKAKTEEEKPEKKEAENTNKEEQNTDE
ncbi:Flp pilus assembly protein CpaB [Oceanobacillus rekensis]|uniref:Flp pilus assembly protein CpaB n=1 Tax=Oceanobacillus rekensis TaxID=937927 RepID=UPI000B442B14|nr:SAF domain-containing protein [Oceanobacillus rekensis]